jgi:hypothetical protein
MISGAARADGEREMGDRFVVRGLDDGDEIVAAEHCVLGDHLAAKSAISRALNVLKQWSSMAASG